MGSLPPGFRFRPTDEELVGYYLHRKVQGLQIELEIIPVVELYKFDPWELPEKSFLPERDSEWFFFCPRDRKYPNGSRTNRATKAGYWKATGKDRKVVCQSSLTGYRKTLVFYRGRAPLGDRTYWVMHEYRLSDHAFEGSPNSQRVFALCRVVKKTGDGYKTRDINRGRKVIASNEHFISDQQFCDISSHGSYAHNESHRATPTIIFESEPCQIESNNSRLWVSPDFILDSSKGYAQASPRYEYLNSTRTWQSCENPKFLTSSLYSYLTGEIEPFNDLSEHGNSTCLDESEVMAGGRFYQIDSLRCPEYL